MCIRDRGSEALKREFTAYSGLNGKNQEVELDSSYVINLNGGDQMTAGSQAKLMAVISAEALDVTVMPENIYENYLNAGMYQDLAQALGEEFLEANRQICVTGNQEDGGGEKVYGLRLSLIHICGLQPPDQPGGRDFFEL